MIHCQWWQHGCSMGLGGSTPTNILAPHTATIVTTPYTARITFTVFLHASTLSTFTSQFVCQFRSGLVRYTLFIFGIKGLRIAGKNTPNRRLSYLFMFGSIVTNGTSTIGTAINLDGETLTIEFEAFGFFAGASHSRHFFSMRRVDLARTGGTIPRWVRIFRGSWFGFQIGLCLTS